MANKTIDLSTLDGLDQFATVRQLEYLDAIRKTGSMYSAAKDQNVTIQCIARALKLVRHKAAKYSPKEHNYTRPLPPGFAIKGVSQYIDRDGNVAGQWVKSSEDKQQAEAVTRAFVEAMAEDVKGRYEPGAVPQVSESDLLTVYPMGDPHFGMYAWAEEAGEDFDLRAAESLTCGAIDRLIATAPQSETALLLNLGDFFHADNSTNKTPESGHALDVDTRFAKVMEVGVKAMVYCIRQLLAHHRRVIVWMLPGNHDPHASLALSICLDESRVEVDTNRSLYRYHEFGRVLIGAHHGHGAKMGDLPGIMASDRPESWGRTKHRYWYCGHIHHKSVDKEHPGCMVETFRTLAARDAWHSGKGYRAGRDMQAITHHIRHGEVLRTRCDIGMLRDEVA